MKIPTVFKADENGLAVPEFNADCEWVNSEDGLMTIKLDGEQVMVELQDNKWKIFKLYLGGEYFELFRSMNSDAPYWKAFDNQDVKSIGKFEVYGKDIKGNPHKINDTYMIKVFPVDMSLIVNRDRGPRRSTIIPVGDFFNSVKKELEESPEIEGFVFHLEGQSMTLKKIAKVTKKDFGIAWPPVEKVAETNTTQALIVP